MQADVVRNMQRLIVWTKNKRHSKLEPLCGQGLMCVGVPSQVGPPSAWYNAESEHSTRIPRIDD